MKKVFIFASVLTGVSSLAFATQSSVVSQHIATSTQVNVLANGTEKVFIAYVESNVKNVKSLAEWSDFQEIVTLYNQNPAKFLNVSVAKRDAFNKVVVALNETLGTQKNEEAQAWKATVNATAKTFNYLWKNSLVEINVSPDEVFEADTVVSSL